MPEYRQNTAYKDIENIEKETDGENEGISGNTGLPFGLCKKYGIPLPQGATPRDAWEALKGRGIYPPWTEEGKDQYEQNGDHTTKTDGEKVKINPELKEASDKLRAKIEMARGFDAEYADKLIKSLDNLDDNEIMVISKMCDKITINKGSGSCWGNNIKVPDGKPTDLNKELGFDFPATTFYHEMGHAIAKQLATGEVIGQGKARVFGYNSLYTIYVSDFNQTAEMQEIFKQDLIGLFDMASKDGAIKGTVNLDRIESKRKQDVFAFMRKVTNKTALDNGIYEPKWKGYDEYYQSALSQRLNWGLYTREQAEQRAKEATDAAYQRYLTEKAKFDDAKKQLDALGGKEKVKSDFERYGILSDFISIGTNNKINMYGSGYWGHSGTYNKEKANGVETWAEYVAFKMTKDTKGLQIMQQYLPKTYAKYEEIYKTLGEKL